MSVNRLFFWWGEWIVQKSQLRNESFLRIKSEIFAKYLPATRTRQ